MLAVIGVVELLLMVQIGIFWWWIVLVIVVVLADRVVFLLLLTGGVLKGIAPRWTRETDVLQLACAGHECMSHPSLGLSHS